MRRFTVSDAGGVIARCFTLKGAIRARSRMLRQGWDLPMSITERCRRIK